MKNHKKSHNRKQKLYKMSGCSKTCRRKYRGGSPDAPLAYPSNVQYVRNPNLAYTGKGGASCSYGITPNNVTINSNINAENAAYHNTGPVSTGFNFLNSSTQRGGVCQSCDNIKTMNGGGYGMATGMHMNPGCPLNQMGGSHRINCKCSGCKKQMKGGAGVPYPNGLIGTAWTANNNDLPGANGVPGDSNHYALNNYNNDVSRQMVDLGPAPPFTGGRSRKSKKGGYNGFFAQDLINVGRQIQYGIGSAYNAIQGYSAPVNPLPWQDQLTGTSTMKMLAK